MTTQFISSGCRFGENGPASPQGVGPGSYDLPCAISIAPPSYSAFSSTSKRDPFGTIIKRGQTSPSPMAYDVREKLIKDKPVLSSGFNSKTKRFSQGQAWGPLKENWTSEKPLGVQKKSLPQSQWKPVVVESRITAVPSIPTKHQSYGFEEDAVGKLIPQKPNHPG